MKKYFIILAILASINALDANAITITPVEEISTSKKSFQLGNCYNFKNIENNMIYTGSVVYYRPNGMLGEEAQIEIANFIDENGKYIPGKITIIPDNHKNFQEFMNYFTMSVFSFVRGSEISLKPDIHKFVISNTDSKEARTIIPIKPNEPISTCYDDLEYSDVVEFLVTDNVYRQGKLYIKSGTKIYGTIDSIDANGWCLDNAAIHFKEFRTKDVNNKIVNLKSDLTIDGFEILKFKSCRWKQFFNYIPTFIRGKEVDIKTEDVDVKFVLVVE